MIKQYATIWPSARKIIIITECLFYTCGYNSVGYGYKKWKSSILAWYFGANKGQFNLNESVQ